MKLLTVLNKKFPCVDDYSDVRDEDEPTLYGLYKDENDCEPDYFCTVVNDSDVTITDTNGNLLKSGTEQEIKSFIKSMVI